MSGYYHTPPAVIRHNLVLLIASVAAAFVTLRILLHASPDADFTVGRFNIHHLFTGLVLITAGGVPLAIFRGHTPRLRIALVTFGIGLGMALDELVYLIATDGSNASYLLPVSFWGGVVTVGTALAYAIGLAAVRAGGRDRVAREPGNPLTAPGSKRS